MVYICCPALENSELRYMSGSSASQKETGTLGLKAEEIVETASRLFSQQGYNSTSLKEIADEVGLHKTTLFHYFKNKEEILMEVMNISFEEYTTILDDSLKSNNLNAEEKFRLALEEQVSVICKYRDYLNVALNEIKSLSPKNREKYTRTRIQYGKHFEKIIQEVQADKNSTLFKGLDSKIVNLGILGMCNWLIKWYREDGGLTPKEISDIFYNILAHKIPEKK